jgi:exopolysaccharide production protein ExoZ
VALHIIYRNTPILGWGVPAAVLVGVCVLSPHRLTCTNPACRALLFLGDASYALYLVHPIALALPRWLFPHLIEPETHPWLYAAMLLFLAIAASIVVYVAFERPTTQVLQKGIKVLVARTIPGSSAGAQLPLPRSIEADAPDRGVGSVAGGV